ncbi:MAG: metallophosphoesterase [Ruminococcus sp.]|nr:metallophosphoesterase [Ruminococcus sp.]
MICNKDLRLSKYTVTSQDLPHSFQGFRIAQVSDLHNRTLGKDNKKLLSMLRECKPDIIVMTGDIIDSRTPKVSIATDFAQEAAKIAPCYYVPGNHEARVPEDFEALLAGLGSAGIKVLRNESTKLEKDGEYITLLGADDPWFANGNTSRYDTQYMRDTLDSIALGNEDEFTLLLSHRPELFEAYAQHHIDLTLSGHVHGGQIRLPFVGGLYGPNQGLLPTYDKGLYTKDNSNMIVSSGVGNSLFPLRIFNPPEVVLVELQK